MNLAKILPQLISVSYKPVCLNYPNDILEVPLAVYKRKIGSQYVIGMQKMGSCTSNMLHNVIYCIYLLRNVFHTLS